MIFERLRLIDDLIPRNGALNMAVDEMLTQQIFEPTLRIYRWSEPTVTLGYFEKIDEARKLRAGRPLMRRWTGGGLVDHGEDWTYTLVVPVTDVMAGSGRAESYCVIHRIIREIVRVGCGVTLEIAEEAKKAGEGCFARPVKGDLLLDGRKIAGAAQRRTRNALLHQGSIQHISLEKIASRTIAEGFSSKIQRIPLSEDENKRAGKLVATRYDRPEWLERF